MRSRSLMMLSGLVLAASPALATQPSPPKAQPPAQEKIYCLQLEPFTGSRVSRTECKTKKEWTRDGVDLDEALGK